MIFNNLTLRKVSVKILFLGVVLAVNYMNECRKAWKGVAKRVCFYSDVVSLLPLVADDETDVTL